DAVSLVWSMRPSLLAQPDPAGVRAWTLVRLTGILIDRFVWDGYNEAQVPSRLPSRSARPHGIMGRWPSVPLCMTASVSRIRRAERLTRAFPL
ncbi:MAG: hypothetical protein JWO02_2793, partial [Solirubrobacterales bacterium]|nr:hypothetical protein [Solirubrobacterales bacterium]